MSSPLIHERIDFRPQMPCKWCGFESEILYPALPDRMRSSGGTWSIWRCLNPACGLHWLDPVPAEGDLQEAYRDYYTHPETALPGSSGFRLVLRKIRQAAGDSYRDRRFGYRSKVPSFLRNPLSRIAKMDQLTQARLEFSVMYLPADRCGRLLDVGCGSGLFLLEMRNRGWESQGCDVDPKAVEAALSRGLPVNVGTLEEQKYPDDSFDALTLSHVIEHVFHPRHTLRECFRILRPAGRLVVVTPNVKSRTHERFGSAWVHLDPPRHLHLFGPHLLAKTARHAGFEDITCFTSLRESHLSFSRSRAIQKTGRFSLPTRSSFPLNVTSRFYARAHYRMLKENPECGEEIVLIATKRGKRI